MFEYGVEFEEVAVSVLRDRARVRWVRWIRCVRADRPEAREGWVEWGWLLVVALAVAAGVVGLGLLADGLAADGLSADVQSTDGLSIGGIVGRPLAGSETGVVVWGGAAAGRTGGWSLPLVVTPFLACPGYVGCHAGGLTGALARLSADP